MGVARIYSLATPYTEATLPLVKYVQSADTMTLVHPSYAPMALTRTGHAAWTLTTIAFGSSIAAPGTPTVTPTTGTGATRTWRYVVTAVNASGEESVASGIGSTTNNFLNSGANGQPVVSNAISWSAVTGAVTYNVYKEQNGRYGFIGLAAGTSFTDDNIAPDLSDTAPVLQTPFASSNYPGTVTYHEQRQVFGFSFANPQTIWATASGFYRRFSASSPVQDNDAVTLTINAQQVNEVRWIVSLRELVVLTSGSEIVIRPGGGSDILTPTPTVSVQSYCGSGHVKPLVSDNKVLFVQERGSLVRDLGYDYGADGYTGQDLSILVPHLFKDRYIVAWAYQQNPAKVIWCAMSDGALLSFTYVAAQQIYAWARHDTDGLYEDVASVPEGSEDAIYFIVKRTVNGQTRRFIERLRSRQFSDIDSAWFVDCGLAYAGTATSTFGGLSHLEGKTVVVVADGARSTKVVTNGKITLDAPATRVVAGLEYISTITTLPLDLGAAGSGRKKAVGPLEIRVEATRGLKAGPAGGRIVAHKDRTTEALGSAPVLKTGVLELSAQPDWVDDAQVTVQGTSGLPITVLSIAPKIEGGG